MKVPLLDLGAQHATIREDVMAAIDRVVESQYFILGPEVTAFEQEVASFCGAKEAVGMSSGTDALLAALMALDVGPGDEVVTTPFSFFATAGVVARLGARPVFVDIDPLTYNIDPSKIAEVLTPSTRAIMPVHLFGRCADMTRVMQLANSHAIPVVEDAAQAIGSFDDEGRQAGTIGSIGCFSFFPSKNLGAFGDAGMVITNDADLGELLRIIRVHGSKPKYYHKIVGGNFRIDALQAAVLRAKLPHLQAWTEGRRRNAALYRELFNDAELQDIVLPEDVPGHIYNQFVIRAPDRDALQKHLKERNVGTEVYYPLPLHLQECFRDLEYGEGDFPESEKAAGEVLALPVYPELKPEQVRYVVSSVAEFYQRAAV